MRLYNYWRSSSSYRVRIALAYKQVPYEYVAVSLIRGEQRLAAHVARNPSTTVPVLEVEDGVFLSQSVAIAEYLEERFPAAPLFPSSALRRARVRELAELMNSGMQPFHNLSVLTHVREVLKGDEKDWAAHWISRGLETLETMARASAGTYLVGDEVSWADCVLVAQLYGARRFATFDQERFPTVAAIEARLLALPFVNAARPEAQPDAAP